MTQLRRSERLKARIGRPIAPEAASMPVVTLDQLSLETPTHFETGCQPWATPFHSFIHQAALLRDPDAPQKPFHLYSRLPLEIQWMIVEACDATTLFNLMQVSSSIRIRAKPLFWSHSSVWYYADINDLPLHKRQGADKGFDYDFLRQVEQVELVLDDLECWYDYFLTPEMAQDSRNVVDTAEIFWRAFHFTFPCVQRIMFSSPWEALPSGDINFSTLLRVAPKHISITWCMDLQPRLSPAPRRLDRYEWRANVAWVLTDHCWNRHRVFAPKHKVRGPVGKFQRWDWLEKELKTSTTGLRYLRAEAYENYRFGGQRNLPFTCPSPNCQETFERAGEYGAHYHDQLANGKVHDEWWNVAYGEGQIKGLSPSGLLPEEVEKYLERLEQRHNEERNRLAELFAELTLDWGEKGSATRAAYEQEFCAQLKYDRIYRCGDDDPKELQQWRRLKHRMHLAIIERGE
ncbi:hypothetical protein BT63DRAFT_436267 [Microthyrium microscopicum]|uniref:Uncharacterized protein n=1 Tax=Microthyrium microscopicum TaxID=703497 RepID=A0A6A6UV88_9PEZI|nr:hypothetical protein BT63DRAFT_436267 [Microthyrium microscopicum]